LEVENRDDSNGKDLIGNEFKKRLYSITDMVSEIGATEWYWRSQVWNGNLPFIQVGRKMFIESRDIERFIQTHRTSN
jgi:hypothetical protein